NIKSARENYDKALALDPNHKGAHEYLGEMFLILNDLASAQRQLETLATICPRGCEQRDDLQQAIEAYKIRRGS
ncbi:MAG: tetratricopeptide repeat protein, partial [Alphaproteobacteria bacterium]